MVQPAGFAAPPAVPAHVAALGPGSFVPLLNITQPSSSYTELAQKHGNPGPGTAAGALVYWQTYHHMAWAAAAAAPGAVRLFAA